MDPFVRRTGPDDIDGLISVGSAGFGYIPSAEGRVAQRQAWEASRGFTVEDGGQLVASSAILPLPMTVPGGAEVNLAGVTGVAVLPTHRRRGLLSAMMRTVLDDAREHAEPIAGLYASESIIYGRFGYGLAIEHQLLDIDRNYAAFASAAPTPGSVRMIEPGDARPYAEDVWERARRLWPGMTARDERQWNRRFDPLRGGEQPQFYALYEEDGHCDGYVSYRIGGTDWPGGIAANEVNLVELVPVTEAANVALWRFVLSLDLTTQVKTTHGAARPMDDPLPLMLEDPRRLQRVPRDMVWLRIVDVGAALQARRYGADGHLVIEVQDEFRPENSGRYAIDATAFTATEVRTTTAEPDLVLPVASLGAAYLGGTKLSTLARAARAEERTAGALRLADAMFGWDVAPWCPEHW